MTPESTVTKEPKQNGNGAERTPTCSTYRPSVDIVETADELMLHADMPGLKVENIDINFEDRQLTIRGHVAPRQAENTRYMLREYGVGDFYRTFNVSEHVDGSRIRAEYADGVLTLHLPKSEAIKPRKIQVASA